MANTVISITERKEDVDFGKAVAEHAKMNFFHAPRANDLKKFLKDNHDVVCLWDIDHPHAIEAIHPLSISNVGNVMKTLPPDKTFVVSTDPLNNTPYIFNVPYFSHHVYRQFKNPTPELISKLVANCGKTSPFGLDKYMPPNTQIRKIVLKKSGQRKGVINGMTNLLGKTGCPPQLIQMATQTTDEILMNAIFDAPIEGDKTYRRKTERHLDFELTPKEYVELDLAVGPGYLAICARDKFGSLKKDLVLAFIRQNFEKQEYRPREEDHGAGLGIYGILQSGLSLMFSSRPNIMTEVTLFIPIVKNMKTFRNSFRFFSFI